MQLKTLRDKCLLFNQFMIENIELPAVLIEALQESSRLVEKAYVEGNRKPLIAKNRDIDDQILRHMPPKMVADLKEFFKEKMDLDLEVIEKFYKKAIEKVLKKGKISNREEYDILLNRMDEIFADPSKEDEAKKIDKMLSAYRE